MKINDLDNSYISSDIPNRRGKRYRTVESRNIQRKRKENTHNDEISSSFAIFGLFAVFAIIFMLIYIFFLPSPSPIWTFIGAGICWLISGISRFIEGKDIWFGFISFANVLLVFVAFLLQYGII